MNQIDQHVGARLRLLREKQKLSSDELATLVGIDRESLDEIETGRERASAELLQRFCQALSIKPADIYQDAPKTA